LMARKPPPVRMTMMKGRIRQGIKSCAATLNPSTFASSPVMVAIVVTGIPIVAKGVGIVFARRHTTIENIGLNPRETRMLPGINTGDPKPAIASRKDPNPQASMRTIILLSLDIPVINLIITSMPPVATEYLYSISAAIVTNRIGQKAKIAPSAAAVATFENGISTTDRARTAASIRPPGQAICPGR
jgi:hypothetical protein